MSKPIIEADGIDCKGIIEMGEEKLFAWTKKIDDIHYAIEGFHSETLCGRPMLGNNYASMYPKGLRRECPTCLKEIEARGLKI